MKTLVLTLCFLLSASAASAQKPTVAMDFTADDCGGFSHNLFSELDAGNVILMEFIMFNCTPCITARQALQPMFEAFNASHPGKFQIYTIGWTNNMTCAQMQTWMEKHAFLNHFFPGNGDLTDYFGGMGMPTIALVAGKDHKVLYVNDVSTGFRLSDTAVLKSLIAEALTPADVEPGFSASNEFRLYPNPAYDIIRIAIPDAEVIGEVEILNSLGQVVATRSVGATAEIQLTGLTPGFYSIRYSGGGQQRQLSFVKR